MQRPAGWRGAFGQCAAAQTHLASHAIGPGDLFLFFGWFRAAHLVSGAWRYGRTAPDLHVLWGWLQIDRVVRLGDGEEPPHCHWHHPHVFDRESYVGNQGNNALYVAKEYLTLPGLSHVPGSGTFSRYSSQLRLTDPTAATRSIWRLPGWFYANATRTPLSYHSELSRWRKRRGAAQLRSVGRGQEFVLNGTEYPELTEWLVNLFYAHAGEA
jgi:hypothetical protein